MQEFKIVIMMIMKIYIMHGLLESEFQILYTLSLNFFSRMIFISLQEKSRLFSLMQIVLALNRYLLANKGAPRQHH